MAFEININLLTCSRNKLSSVDRRVVELMLFVLMSSYVCCGIMLLAL